jgi:predicted alpha/beta hydrolase
VDVEAIAKVMSERFRQQIAESGLLEAAAVLRGEIRGVSQDIAAGLRPVAMEYKTMAATISGELATLAAAARRLQDENALLRVERRSAAWPWIVVVVLLLLLGVLIGIVVAVWP